MMKKLMMLAVCFTYLGVWGASTVHADENLKRGLAKAQYMLRQSNVEKAEMAQQIKQEKEAVEAKAKELKNTERSLAKAEAKIKKLKSTIELWQSEYEKLKEKVTTTRTALAISVREADQQKAMLATQTQNFGYCEQQNKALVAMSFDLLDAYEGKTAADALKQSDPFFGLKQVEIENLIQDYRHQIEDLDMQENAHNIQSLDTASLAL